MDGFTWACKQKEKHLHYGSDNQHEFTWACKQVETNLHNGPDNRNKILNKKHLVNIASKLKSMPDQVQDLVLAVSFLLSLSLHGVFSEFKPSRRLFFLRTAVHTAIMYTISVPAYVSVKD